MVRTCVNVWRGTCCLLTNGHVTVNCLYYIYVSFYSQSSCTKPRINKLLPLGNVCTVASSIHVSLKLFSGFRRPISSTGCFKKVAFLNLFGIFSLRLSLFARNFADLLAIHIYVYLPIFVDLSKYFIKWR